MWSCRWLVDDNTSKLLRPDISHYVIDIIPDFITAGGQKVPAIQVWIDPRYPEAHRDPNFREWLRQHEGGCVALIRFNERDAMVLIPPHMSDTGAWEEVGGPRMVSEDRTHSAEEIAAVLTNSGAMK